MSTQCGSLYRFLEKAWYIPDYPLFWLVWHRLEWLERLPLPVRTQRSCISPAQRVYWMASQLKTQGSLYRQAERKYSNFDPLPDADNAAVGSQYPDFLQEGPQGTLLFFCGPAEGERPGPRVCSDGKPCSGVRGSQQAPTELPQPLAPGPRACLCAGSAAQQCLAAVPKGGTSYEK